MTYGTLEVSVRRKTPFPHPRRALRVFYFFMQVAITDLRDCTKGAVDLRGGEDGVSVSPGGERGGRRHFRGPGKKSGKEWETGGWTDLVFFHLFSSFRVPGPPRPVPRGKREVKPTARGRDHVC